MRKYLALFLIASLLLVAGTGCSAKQKGDTDRAIFKTFQTAKDTYALAHQSIMFTSQIVNQIGTPACTDMPTGEICKAARAYVKVYTEDIQPASVKADEAFREAVAAFDAYLAGTSDEATLLEKLEAFQEVVALLQKYFGGIQLSHKDGFHQMFAMFLEQNREEVL